MKRGREVHGAADRVDPGPDVALDCAQAHKPAMNAHAKSDGTAIGATQPVFPDRRRLNAPRRLAGLVGMVFKRVRPAKHRKPALARIADEQPAGFFNRAFEMVEDAIDKLVRLMRISVGDKARWVDRVNGEHRQHAAFHETGRALRDEPGLADAGLADRRDRAAPLH